MKKVFVVSILALLSALTLSARATSACNDPNRGGKPSTLFTLKKCAGVATQCVSSKCDVQEDASGERVICDEAFTGIKRIKLIGKATSYSCENNSPAAVLVTITFGDEIHEERWEITKDKYEDSIYFNKCFTFYGRKDGRVEVRLVAGDMAIIMHRLSVVIEK